MATVLTRTPSSAGNHKKYTWSSWVKRSALGYQFLYTQGNDGNNNNTLVFNSDNSLTHWNYQGGFQLLLRTTRLFRDTNAWYHIVISVDTTQSTASDRAKMYINGERITAFKSGEETYPSQNLDLYINNTHPFKIGSYWNGTSNSALFDGLMSHVHFIDGTAYDASTFGETDSTTGEWKIKTDVTATYGTNGFHILKNGNTITDQSSNSNNFAVEAGTLTKTEDCPSNVFATWNSSSPNDQVTYSYGNGVVTGSTANNYSMSTSTTLGASSGKYYWEMKYSTAGNGNECVGVANFDNYEYNQNMTSGTTGYVSLRWDGERQINGATTSNYFSPPSTGAVIMCAMDMDNGKVFFGSNGTWFGSGNPVTGANPTADILTSGTWGGILRYLNSKWECNFGNGYFADQTVSSAGTNASGNGIFEYDVPTGYTALSTKGLNL